MIQPSEPTEPTEPTVKRTFSEVVLAFGVTKDRSAVVFQLGNMSVQVPREHGLLFAWQFLKQTIRCYWS